MDDERKEELETLVAIFPELHVDSTDAFTATLELPVSPADPLLIRFAPHAPPSQVPRLHDHSQEPDDTSDPLEAANELRFAHLPPFTLHITLPLEYPANNPPVVKLSTQFEWLPEEKVNELEREVVDLWEECGRCQILFAYIDHLQQAAERGFDLGGSLTLPVAQKHDLITFNRRSIETIFNAGTYDCGICLDPKKGVNCYRMKHCGHVFCRECLQDVYQNAIKEGDVTQVKCLEPGCAAERIGANGLMRKRKTERTVHPRELLDMGVEQDMVRRYLEMRRKKKLEADKSTAYCPRTWCQGPAKSDKYPMIPKDLNTHLKGMDVTIDPDSDIGDGAEDLESGPGNNPGNIPPNIADRVAICEQCTFAFCKVCYKSWHGPFARCQPRDPTELSAEEKASYEYIRKFTSPCAYCNAPVQKTMGCNHMICFNCNTHFCYLCAAYLQPENPYKHFNVQGGDCFQRLWELEEGDDGQAPEDGRGFGGARAAELAVEVARAADAAEEAARLQAEENAAALPAAPEPPVRGIPLADVLAQLNLDEEVVIPDVVVHAPPQNQGRAGRRQRNPFAGARPNGQGAAQAVRNHERAGRGGQVRGGRRAPAARAGNEQEDVGDRQQMNLALFLEAAGRDREDDWDSDGMGDDEDFAIALR